MDNTQATGLVTKVFASIKESTTEEDLKKIVENDPHLSKHKFDSNLYPDLKISLSPKEIASLKVEGKLTDQNKINTDLNPNTLSPLEKLLYAVLWKNGDLGKERHIAEGILSTNDNNKEPERNGGLVFYQFGKHLADRQEPIIDQHTIRAFELHEYSGKDDSAINKIRKRPAVNINDLRLLDDYKCWTKSVSSKNKEIQFQIDKILYALGKVIKIPKSKQPP